MLDYYGIRGNALNLFKSYLTDRQQFTEIGDTLSNMEYIKWGVPQGSILGSLHGILYNYYMVGHVPFFFSYI